MPWWTNPPFYAVATAMLVAGCEGTWDPSELSTTTDNTPEPVEITLVGEHVRMGVGDGLTVCGWSFEYIDRFIELYTAESSHGSISTPVEYYYVDDDTVHRQDICPSSRACTRSGVAYAQTPLLLHEVVHAVRQIQFGTNDYPGASFLEEGLAQLHSPSAVGWDDDFSVLDLPDVIEDRAPAGLYDPAAQLLSIVADEASFETVEALVDASEDLDAPEDVEPTVVDVTGLTLADLDARYSARPNCSPAARARLLVECNADPYEWIDWMTVPSAVASIGSLSCGEPRALGPEDGRLWTFYPIDIPSEGLYELEVDEDEPGQLLQVVACDSACGPDVDLLWDEAWRREDVMLPAGRHVFRLSREVGDENSVGFTLRGPLP